MDSYKYHNMHLYGKGRQSLRVRFVVKILLNTRAALKMEHTCVAE